VSSATFWNRIEIDTHHESLAEGLAARIHDPLWMLARQWQMGELQGKNAGSPLRVDVTTASSVCEFVRMASREDLDSTIGQPMGFNPSIHRPFDPRQAPLEAMVEQDGATPAPPDVRLRARGGRFFSELVAKAGLGGFQAALLATLDWDNPLQVTDEVPFIRRVRGRIPDASKIIAALDAADVGTWPTRLAMDATQVKTFFSVCSAWRAWYGPRAGVRPASTWNAGRLDYSFELIAPVPSPQQPSPRCRLVARDYEGGRLDWDSFRVRGLPGASNQPGGPPPSGWPMPAPPTMATSSTVPVPVTFPGMPAPRFWTMEDGKIDLGNIDAGPGDIGRVLLAEFALLWANDWYVVPVPIDQTGALVRATVGVTDSFGVHIPMQQAHQVWRDPSFKMFRLTSLSWEDPTLGIVRGDGLSGILFVPPVVPGSFESTIEEVQVLRDEGANVAWALERLVPGLLGRPVRVKQDALPPLAPPEGEPDAAPDTTAPTVLRYQPATPARPGWTPFAPVALQSPARVELRLAQVVDPSFSPTPPAGRIVSAELHPLDDEVPREGLVLRRRVEVARAQNGALHMWVSRDTALAGGDVSSGLRYDFLTEIADDGPG
jgi:hypothetical protein